MKKLILVLFLFLFSCEKDSSSIHSSFDPLFDRTNQTHRINVVTHLNLNELNEAYDQRIKENGLERNPSRKLGWSGWSMRENRIDGGFYCEIHIAFDPTSPHITEQQAVTLGHEMFHCLYGTYHPE